MQRMTITCLYQGNNILGEGPVWDYRHDVLYWLDIEQAQLHQFNPQNSQKHTWALPDKPGAIALHANGGLLIALRKKFVLFNPITGKINLWLQALSENSVEVFNDGKCDHAGRFWIGTKDVKENSPTGALYRLDPDGSFLQMDKGFIVSNGLGWSPDNKFMYFTDGAAHRKILRYDFDIASGNISNRQVFTEIPKEDGYPDGLTIDNEGYIWGVHWDGWKITRYAPNGKIERVVTMPVQKPSSCCFGGIDLDTLFITSARRDLTGNELEKQPQAGALFSFKSGIKGMPEAVFGE
jgi:sugar lactone lactonase YvrE